VSADLTPLFSQAGECFTVVSTQTHFRFWWKGQHKGVTGLFPADFVEELDDNGVRIAPQPTPGSWDYNSGDEQSKSDDSDDDDSDSDSDSNEVPRAPRSPQSGSPNPGKRSPAPNFKAPVPAPLSPVLTMATSPMVMSPTPSRGASSTSSTTKDRLKTAASMPTLPNVHHRRQAAAPTGSSRPLSGTATDEASTSMTWMSLPPLSPRSSTATSSKCFDDDTSDSQSLQDFIRSTQAVVCAARSAVLASPVQAGLFALQLRDQSGARASAEQACDAAVGKLVICHKRGTTPRLRTIVKPADSCVGGELSVSLFIINDLQRDSIVEVTVDGAHVNGSPWTAAILL
jgi:hypothetical protein